MLRFLADENFNNQIVRNIELLCDRVANGPDEQLREWAEKQLKMKMKDGGTI